MSQDVGADINLINKLTATVQQPVPQVALTSNCTSEVCAISSDSWKNNENHAAENQLIPPFPSLDLNDTDGGSLVIATREESTPLRKVSSILLQFFQRFNYEIHGTTDTYIYEKLCY